MKSLFTIAFVFCFLGSFGQYNETIELRNGSVIRGKIVEQNDQQLRIRKKDGSVMVFNAKDVVSVDQYEKDVRSKGYYLRGTFGVLGGPNNAGITMQLFQGYSFNNHWQAGAGFGFEILGWNPYVPAFLELQYNLLNKPSSPFVKVFGGYDFPLNFSETNGGFTFGSSIGYRHFLTHRLALTTSIGYRYVRLLEQGFWDDFVTIRQVNRFELSVGLTFR